MKPNEPLNDRHAVFNRRLKRVGLAALASYVPATLLVGFNFGWDFGQWMVAWTGSSMGAFLTIMVLFGIAKCPMEREKGQPRPKKGRRN